MILLRSKIIELINKKEIEIKPFNEKCLGPNSYDITLANTLFEFTSNILNTRKTPKYREYNLNDYPDGFTLKPGSFYLGVTKEWTRCTTTVPILEGRSSTARYNITIHQAAGFGDIGFAGHWTLEITVTKPTIIYSNMRIGQVAFIAALGSDGVPVLGQNSVSENYSDKGNYNNQFSSTPKPSLPVAGNF